MIGVVSPGPYLVTAVLGALVILAAVLAARRTPRAATAIRSALALVLLGDAIVYLASEISSGSFSASGSLPLALCNALVLVAALACATTNQLATELTWFLGLAGSLEGLLTPDLSTPFPHLVFFEYLLGHLGVVGAALVLVLGCHRTPRRGAVHRVFAITLVYAGIVGVIDATEHANYLFLRRPPGNWTLLRLLGPWPYYIAVAALLALALFSLLDAPFVARRRRATPPAAPSPIVLWSVLLALGIVVFPLMALLRRRERRWRLLLGCGELVRRLAGVPVTRVGAVPAAPVVICPNHTSFLDGLVVVLTIGPAGPLTFLVSQAISRQLVAGTFLRLIGATFVGSTGASPRRLLAGLADELTKGRSVVVFPEGSIGEGPLRHFHLGAFVLALDAGVPVVPLAIRGAGAVLPAGARSPRAGAITVEVGRPITAPPDSSRAARVLAEATKAALDALLAPHADGAAADRGATGRAPGAVSSLGSASSC